MIRPVTAAAALLVLAFAASAAAQTSTQPRVTQSIGGGPQWAYPTQGDTMLNGTPGIRGSWRGWFGPHLGLEGDFGWWKKSMTHEYRSPEFNVLEDATLTVYNVGMNVLGGIPIGRAKVVIGGGPGWFFERGAVQATVNGDRQSYNSSRRHFGFQTVTDLEVLASTHVSVFGGMRAEWRDVGEFDSGVVYPIAGVRFLF